MTNQNGDGAHAFSGPMVQVQVEGTRDPVTITEQAAKILLKLCDSTPLVGASSKVSIGLAQSELEAALRTLEQQRAMAQQPTEDIPGVPEAGAPGDAPSEAPVTADGPAAAEPAAPVAGDPE